MKGIELCFLVFANHRSTFDIVVRLRRTLDGLLNAPKPMATEPVKLLSSQATREDFVMLMLIKPFLPDTALKEALSSMLRLWSSETTFEPKHPFLISAGHECLKETLARPETDVLSNLDGPTLVLKAWLNVAAALRKGEAIESLVLLSTCLEALLCRYLSRGTNSATLYLSTTGIGNNYLFESITAARMLQGKPVARAGCLLTTLVEFDPHRFASALVKFVCSKNDDVQKLWQAGVFDLPLFSVSRRGDIMDALGLEGRALVSAIMQRCRILVGKMVRSRTELYRANSICT